MSQDAVKILVPRPDDTLRSRSLFISIQKDTAHFYVVTRLALLIDDDLDLSGSVRTTRHGYSCYYSGSLKPGRHSIVVRTYDASDIASEVRRTFYVPYEFAPEKPRAGQARDLQYFGDLNVYTRASTLKGSSSAQALLQTPNPIQEVSLGFTIKHRYFEIPIRGYFTNLNYSTIQPRNRVNVGFRSQYFDAEGGDLTPVYDKLVLSGTPVRGGIGTAKLSTVDLSVVHGVVLHSVEGTLLQYDASQGFPPGNLMVDSTHYIRPGTYQRTLTAGQFRWFSEDNQSVFAFTFLKSGDDQSSIKYGQSPSQNVATSLSYSLHDPGFFLSGDMGLAISATTRDIAPGMVSDSVIKAALGRELPVNTDIVKEFLIVNSSTYPLNIKELSSLAFHTSMSARYLGRQQLNFICDYIGPAYTSFGNPYLLSDRFNLSATNSLMLWDSKVMLLMNAAQDRNNLKEVSLITTRTQRTGFTIMLRPDATLPVISITSQYMFMATRPQNGDTFTPSSRIAIWSLNTNYYFTAWNIRHNVFALLGSNLTTVYNSGFADRNYTMFGLGVTETIADNYSVSASYQRNGISASSTTLSTQDLFNYSAGVNGLLPKLHLQLKGMVSSASDGNTNSTRIQHSLMGQYGMGENLDGTLEAGWSKYTQSSSSEYDYDEYFIMLRLGYRFAF
jgi:hypothetical protein